MQLWLDKYQSVVSQSARKCTSRQVKARWVLRQPLMGTCVHLYNNVMSWSSSNSMSEIPSLNRPYNKQRLCFTVRILLLHFCLMLQNPISGRGHCPPWSGQAGVPARQGGGCRDQGDHPQPLRRLPHPRWRRPQRVLPILRRPHHSHLQWNCAGNAVNITFLHTSDLGLTNFFCSGLCSKTLSTSPHIN